MRVPVMCLMFLGGLVAAGQSVQVQFEVASIRPSESPRKPSITTSPGALTMRNSSLSDCVRWAYGVMDYQISANEAWMTGQQFDISAKTGHASTDAELKTMLQGLLADRFKLVFHRQSKEMAVMTMSLGKNMNKLHESPGEGESSLETPNDVAVGKHASMADLAQLASSALRIPVIDQTGLTGRYDFTIDTRPYMNNDAPVDRPALLISILQGELGLKVESKKLPIDMLVIDHAEKPSN